MDEIDKLMAEEFEDCLNINSTNCNTKVEFDEPYKKTPRTSLLMKEDIDDYEEEMINILTSDDVTKKKRHLNTPNPRTSSQTLSTSIKRHPPKPLYSRDIVHNYLGNQWEKDEVQETVNSQYKYGMEKEISAPLNMQKGLRTVIDEEWDKPLYTANQKYLQTVQLKNTAKIKPKLMNHSVLHEVNTKAAKYDIYLTPNAKESDDIFGLDRLITNEIKFDEPDAVTNIPQKSKVSPSSRNNWDTVGEKNTLDELINEASRTDSNQSKPLNYGSHPHSKKANILEEDDDFVDHKDSLAFLLDNFDKQKAKAQADMGSTSMSFWRCIERTVEINNALKEVYKRNMDNQPSLKQLKLREEEEITHPMALIKKTGKTGSAIRQFFYTDLSSISHIMRAKSKRMQFKIKPFLSEKPKYESSICEYEDCLRCRYTTINNYNGYQLLHFGQLDTIMILGSIHSRMLIGFVVPKDIQQEGIQECGVIDTKFLNELSFSHFPKGHRTYCIPSWKMLGHQPTSDKKSYGQLESVDAKLFDEVKEEDSSLSIPNPPVVAIAIVMSDFNLEGKERTIDLSLNEDDFNNLEDEINCQVSFLKLMKNDMVCLTTLPAERVNGPNNSGWFEGYKASDETCRVGLCHTDFIHIIQF